MYGASELGVVLPSCFNSSKQPHPVVCSTTTRVVLSLLMLLMLVIYAILANHYKLRKRDRHINIHAIVEEHYERYFEQKEEYMRDIADSQSDINWQDNT